jgi:hypothetical protein
LVVGGKEGKSLFKTFAAWQLERFFVNQSADYIIERKKKKRRGSSS